jgi:peptide/nickel transport system substrate-binding protein
MKKFFGLLFSAWCLSGCSTPQPSQAPHHILRYGIQQAPSSLDPATSTDVVYCQIVFNIFETLIAMDWEKGEFMPRLATSWQPDSSGERWTFSLRPGVVFHDGSPLNAEAVKVSLGRQFDANNPYYKPGQTDTYGHFALSMIKEIRALNDSMVQFVLEYPYAAFLDNLATPNFAAIVSPRALKEFGEDFGRHPIGTGPFQFESWAPDSQIVVEKFERYWGKPPQIDRVIYRVISNLEARLQQLLNGELEAMSGMSAASVNQLYHTPGIKVVEMGLISTLFLGFNCEAYPFSEVKMRRAVAHALDKKSMVNSISRGLAVVARGPLPPMAIGYDTTLVSQSYEPQLAKALLQSSGYHDGTAVQLSYFAQTDTLRADPMAQAIKDYLETIGMTVDLALYDDWQAFHQNVLVAGKGQLFRDGWMGYTRHPDNFLYPLFHSQSTHNFFKYKNSQVDSLLEEARRTPDELTQRRLYRKVQEIILQDVPAVFISHPKAVYAVRDRVKNFKIDPLAIPWLHEVELEQEREIGRSE